MHFYKKAAYSFYGSAMYYIYISGLSTCMASIFSSLYIGNLHECLLLGVSCEVTILNAIKFYNVFHFFDRKLDY